MNTTRLLLLAVGAYLLWFGVTHWGQKDPSGPLKDLFAGRGLS